MNKKGLIIGISSALAVIAIFTAVFLLLKGGKKEESYRVIKVMSVEGVATVYRENAGDLSAYEGMALQNGDMVHLEGNSKMVLMLDDDKYAFVEENTNFALYAIGSSSSSKTAFDIQTGAITCQAKEKLSDDSSYYINTPNSTMAIRGTMVRISVSEAYTDEYATLEFNELAKIDSSVDNAKKDVITVTRMTTFEGEAEIGLHTATSPIDYVYNRETGKLVYEANGFEKVDSYYKSLSDKKQLSVGKESVIGGKGDGVSYYIIEPRELDVTTYPDQAVESLKEAMENDPEKETCITKSELEQLINEENHTVTFMYNGKVFGTQTVVHGKTVNAPAFVPDTSGSWATDFNTPVTEDVTIQWR